MAGDLVVGVEPGAPISCALHELTAVPNANGACGAATGGAFLVHATGSYKTRKRTACATRDRDVHNRSGGIVDPSGTRRPGARLRHGGLLYNLGGAPQVQVYAIRGGSAHDVRLDHHQLRQRGQLLTSVVDDIVSMRAIYGRTTWARRRPARPRWATACSTAGAARPRRTSPPSRVPWR